MRKFFKEALLAAALSSASAVESKAQNNRSVIPVEKNVVGQVEDKDKQKKPFLNLTYFGVEMLGLGNYQELTPEYAWQVRLPKGKVSGFGFAEVRPKSTFTSHNIDYQPSPKVPISGDMEAGLAGSKSFASAGAKFDLAALPKVSKVFDAATVTYLRKVAGVAPDQQVLFVWDTKSLPLAGKVAVSSEGFYRTHIKYGQPQILIDMGFKKIKGLVQFDVAGSTVKVSAGLKVYVYVK